MAEVAVDVTVANRFISSLSKSLQALCHGCMDFDSGIEIVGYININIDSGSKVDYVLNEKVLKSNTNSMTFVSNSFLAKKDQQKQLRDGACSPVEELQHSISNNRQRIPYNHSGLQHHKSFFPHSSQSHVLRGAHKRTWNGGDRDWRASPKKHSRGAKSTYSRSHEQFESGATDSSFLQPDPPTSDSSNSNLNIKQECPENNDNENSEPNPSRTAESNESTDINIKQDPDTIPLTKTDSIDFPSSETSSDLKDNFLGKVDSQQNDANENELGASFSGDYTSSGFLPSESDNFQNVPHASGSAYQTEDSGCLDVPVQFEGQDDISYPHGALNEQGEGSEARGQFDVIEIGDEDEDVQAMFGDDQSRKKSSSKLPKSRPTNQSATMNVSHHSGISLPPLLMGVRSGEKFCHICQVDMTSHLLLKRHLCESHGHVMPYTCEFCGKGFLSSNGLAKHAEACKGNVYSCPICDVKFSQTGKLKRHMNDVHKSNQCSSCLGIFKRGKQFNEHVKNCLPNSSS